MVVEVVDCQSDLQAEFYRERARHSVLFDLTR
jgi:hypothetical protein